MSKNLQLGIDVGRIIAVTDHYGTPNDLRAIAQRILDMLGINIVVNEDVAFLLGLGYGLSDRRRVPIEAEALEIIGGTANKEKTMNKVEAESLFKEIKLDPHIAESDFGYNS